MPRHPSDEPSSGDQLAEPALEPAAGWMIAIAVSLVIWAAVAVAVGIAVRSIL